MMAWVQVSHSPQETEALGAELAGRLQAGQVVLVEGELGAGKTTFVRGACRALGVRAQIRSPTFNIGHRYRGRIPVAHIDLYRIPDLRREDPDLLADYLQPDTIAFVEWPGSETELGVPGRLAARVSIEHREGDERTIAIDLAAGAAMPGGDG